QHESRIQHAMKRIPLGRHARDDWVDDVPHDPRVEDRVDERARRERAHAARIRAAVVIEDPLVILRSANWYGARPIADREKRYFRTGEALFDHHPVAGRAEPPLSHGRSDRRFGGTAILGDHYALASSEAVGLDDEWKPEFAA